MYFPSLIVCLTWELKIVNMHAAQSSLCWLRSRPIRHKMSFKSGRIEMLVVSYREMWFLKTRLCLSAVISQGRFYCIAVWNYKKMWNWKNCSWLNHTKIRDMNHGLLKASKLLRQCVLDYTCRYARGNSVLPADSLCLTGTGYCMFLAHGQGLP